MTPTLLGERPQARADELLLVSGGDDDADAQCRVRQRERHQAKGPRFDEVAAFFVVLVRAVGKHSYQSTLPAVLRR